MNKRRRNGYVVAIVALAMVAMLLTTGRIAIAESGTPVASPAAFPAANTASNAVYLTIDNTGKTADRLLGASSPVAAAVEIRTMEMQNGVLQPVTLADGLEIPAGEQVVLQPGKAMLMLLGLHQGFAGGFTFDLTLHFEDAGDITVQIPVLANAPAESDAAPVTVGDISVSAGWSRPFELADDQCGCGIPDAAKQFVPVASPTAKP
jgi:copper(I)-binding protein